jgi:hypothetical protein
MEVTYQGQAYTVTVPVHRFILNTLTRIPAPLAVDPSGRRFAKSKARLT